MVPDSREDGLRPDAARAHWGDDMSSRVRLTGYALLAVASLVVFIALKPNVQTVTPTLPSATTYESLIATALSDFDLNNITADSAPKQQVVNGWITRDLLTIIAKEQVDVLKSQGAVVDVTGSLRTAPFDERIPALLVIGVLALCWTGAASRAPEVVAAPAAAHEGDAA